MSKATRILLAALLLAAAMFTACKGGEDEYAEPEAFSFVIYPGAKYLGQLTEVTKNAHKIFNPNVAPPPTAIYDTDASLETVADYYVKQYGYKEIAQDAGTAAAAKPNAYWRSGDLAADAKGAEAIAKQLGLNPDITKAAGAYRAIEIAPRPNRPRVVIQRPYFDMTTSQVVDRTLILMSR